jgi:DNA gyrase/topoisomerase IV subunit A
MADDETTPEVLKKIQAQLADITAKQANIGALIMIHATLLDCLRSDLKQIRDKVDKLARTKTTMPASDINSINAELDRLEQYFANRQMQRVGKGH